MPLGRFRMSYIGIYGGEVEGTIGQPLKFKFSMLTDKGVEVTSNSNAAILTSGHSFNVYKADGSLISGTRILTRNSSISTMLEISAGNYTVSDTDFAVGDVGFISVQLDASSGTDPVYLATLKITNGETISKQLTTDIADTEADDLPNSIIGRLYTVEKNQIEVLMPRLKRTLGLLGEHQVVDGFVYDDDGNITQCRVRIFEDKADAQGCNRWTDTLNSDDPATSLETGEIARYTTLVSNLLPRNLRTLYDQRISTDATDNGFGDLGSTGGSTL